MRLEKVTPKNYEAALGLSVRPDQEDLVGPVVKSLAEAYVFPDIAWPRLIFDGDRLVGFLMAFLDYAGATTPMTSGPASGDSTSRPTPRGRVTGGSPSRRCAPRSALGAATGRTSPGCPGRAGRRTSI